MGNRARKDGRRAAYLGATEEDAILLNPYKGGSFAWEINHAEWHEAFMEESKRLTEIEVASNLFDEACDRLFDMLLGDDGEAFFQAEAFLKRHKPDLYNKIGGG